MLQDIDPLSVGILFQNRYRIVRCIKGGPPSAVYEVVDEEKNTCCLLEVVASGAVTIDDIGGHSQTESRRAGLFEDEQNIHIFEPDMDEETEQPYFVPEQFASISTETNADVDDGFDIDIPIFVEEPSPSFLAPLPIPIPPIPPSLGTRAALPPPPPLCAQSSPSVPPPLAPISWPPPIPLRTGQSLTGSLPALNPPPRFPSMDGETTLVNVQRLLPPRELIASPPPRHESPFHGSVEPLVVSAAQLEVLPSSSPQNTLRDRFLQHRGVVITLAIGIGLVALGLLGLWTQQKYDVPVENSNRINHARETPNSENAAPAPISTSAYDSVSPLTAGSAVTQTQRATRDTSTKTTDKAARGAASTPPTGRQTKSNRERLY